MSRVLAYTTPALGHLYPMTPTLDELVARGHEVILRTISSGVEQVAGRGFDVGPIDPAIEELEFEDWRESDPRKALKRSVEMLASRGAPESAELQALIDEHRPDCLLVDMNCFGGLAVAERWGGPWAAFCPFPLPLSAPESPPYGPGLAPARGPIGRMRDRVLGPIVRGTLNSAMMPAMSETRVALGLEPLSTTDEMVLRPPLLINTTAEPFEYPRQSWPESIRLVGACDWEPAAEPPAWLDEVDRPIVLVTTSSIFQNDGRLVEVAFEALEGEDVEVVATVPSGEIPPISVPGNARLVEFCPHGPILDRAVCAITHGGMGATQKALARAVPVCAVPFGRDQSEVARRVETAKAGTMLPAKKLTPARLRASVARARTMSDGASIVAAGYRSAGGAAAAVDALEELIEQRPAALAAS